jgi:hypothetical protein
MRGLTIACLLVLSACKQDCETTCQQQLGCSTELDAEAAARVGPTCKEACADRSYTLSDACVTCLDSHGLCMAFDGGYAYQGCDSVCPPTPVLR